MQPLPDPLVPSREGAGKKAPAFPPSQLLLLPQSAQTQLEACQQESLDQAAHKGQPPGAWNRAGERVDGSELGA